MLPLISILLLYLIKTSQSKQDTCPGLNDGTPFKNSAKVPSRSQYISALSHLNIKSVFKDIYNLLTNSQKCWPADTYKGEANYGPLFIRLAWHCSGTFRSTDNKGGCAGGRQRFQPESSWEDNTNLDKARALLAPIKHKYGDSLSWGDLMVFAGTASILYMGGPVTEVCGGRIDQPNGKLSYYLDEEARKYCDKDGKNCDKPTGQTMIGLIYVNPEGLDGVPEPDNSVDELRDIFGRMGMNDWETVALIGGGHSFGKCHGACPDGHGESPKKNPKDPWNGNCGTGKGKDTYTSGFEGWWTKNPFKWDNEYFKHLMYDDYKRIKGPGNKYQWKNKRNGLLMLTTDLTLRHDKDYLDIVAEYADNIELLEWYFANAWEKLTTAGDGWVKNKYRVCISAKKLVKDLNKMNKYSYKAVTNNLNNEANNVKETKSLTDMQIILRMITIGIICSLGAFILFSLGIVCWWKGKA